MSLKVFTVQQKIDVIEEIITAERHRARQYGESARGTHSYEALKSIAADLRARQDKTRSNPYGALERQVVAVKASKTALGYSVTSLTALAETLIGKWPFVSQALEHFGEESAE